MELGKLLEQYYIVKEDEENYRKFMEDGDFEAFEKLVQRLIDRLGQGDEKNGRCD